MSVDRILQLKLIADVGDINGKMGSAQKTVQTRTDKMKGAFKSLKGFAGPVMLSMGMEVAGALKGMFDEQLQHAADLRDAFHALSAVSKTLDLSDVKLGIDTSGLSKAEAELARVAAKDAKLRAVADELRDIGVSVGVGEDAKIVGALREMVAMTGKLGLSRRGVEAIFDAMAAFDMDFDTAKALVINGIFLGRSRYLDQYGISGKTAAERLKDFSSKFGDAAEEFAQTTDGKWAVATAEWDGHMLNLAILADKAMVDLKTSLVVGWNNLAGIVTELANIWDAVVKNWGPVWEDIVDIVDTGFDKIEPILTPLRGILEDYFVGPFRVVKKILASIWKGLTGNFEGARDDLVAIVKDLANTVIDLLNKMSAAFAFSFSFEIPSFEVPDPTQLLEGGTITIGGGSVDFSRGRLFPAIPKLAAGGIVTRPTLAMVGESGPEAVVPLGNGLGNNYTINVSAPASAPADVGRAVVEAIEAFERRAGAGWRR